MSPFLACLLNAWHETGRLILNMAICSASLLIATVMLMRNLDLQIASGGECCGPPQQPRMYDPQ